MSFFAATELRDEVREPGEILWAFFERSSWKRSERIRKEVDGWLSDLPEADRPEFLSRLKVSDDRLVRSTHAELAVHAIMRLCRRTDIVVGPVTSAGRADYLLTDADLTLEVCRASNSDPDHALERRRTEVIAGLNKIKSPDYWLQVRMSLGKGRTPSITSLRGEINQWLAGLDHNAESQRFAEEGPSYQPSLFSKQNTHWRLTLEALPRSERGSGTDTAVGVIEGGPLVIRGPGGIRSAIRKKRKQHVALPGPLMIVLDLTEDIVHDDEIAASLYGPVVDDRTGPIPLVYRRRRGCVWPEDDKAPRPAAVLTIDYLQMGWLSDAKFVLWLSPPTQSPLLEGPWITKRLAVDGETVTSLPPAASLAEYYAGA